MRAIGAAEVDQERPWAPRARAPGGLSARRRDAVSQPVPGARPLRLLLGRFFSAGESPQDRRGLRARVGDSGHQRRWRAAPLRAQQVIGHTSLRMTGNYLHAGQDFSDVLAVTDRVFEP